MTDSGAIIADDSGETSKDDGGTEAGVDAQSESDAPVMPVNDASSPPGPDGGLCVPNNDGTIVREELLMLAGLHANFEFAENATVDSAGVMNANGSYTWDLTGPMTASSTTPFTADHAVLVTTQYPAGQWFSSAFATATYTTKLTDISTLIGIFQGTPGSLQLLGVASPTSGTGQTELTYKTPIDVLAVPMKLGSTWSSNSIITGTAEGLTSDYTEEYVSKVDKQGTLKTPYGTFDVLRVQTTLTRNDLGIISEYQSFSFVAECFGSVAGLTSQVDETTVDFTNAAQVQRLTP